MGDETNQATDPSTTISIDFDPPKKRKRAPGEAAGTRKENDAYDTDPAVALPCVEWVRDHVIGDARYILDPTSGMGPFVLASRRAFPNANVAAVDIREEDGIRRACLNMGASFHAADALVIPQASIARSDLIVTNPPFKLADALARHFYANMHEGAVLAFLLNVTFIGSEDRWVLEGDMTPRRGRPPGPGLFIIAPLAYVVPIQPRPQFLTVNVKGEKASSPIECALFVWVKGAPGENFEPGRAPHAAGAIIPNEPIRWKK